MNRLFAALLALAIGLPACAQFDFRTTGTRAARILELRPTTGSAPSLSEVGAAKFFIPDSISGYNTGNVYISQNGGAWVLLSSFVTSGTVTSVFGRTGVVTALQADYDAFFTTTAEAVAAAPVQSIFGRTGVVTANTGDYTALKITNTPAGGIAATTVQAALNGLDTEKANLASPTFTGNPLAPTPSTADNDTSIATTAFTQAVLTTNAVTSVFGRTGAILALAGDYTATKVNVTPGGGLASSNVQTALEELQGEVIALETFQPGTYSARTSIGGEPSLYLRIDDTLSSEDNEYRMFMSGETLTFRFSDSISSPDVTMLTMNPFGGVVVQQGFGVVGAASITNGLNMGALGTATTPATADNDTSVATTAHVHAAIAADGVELSQDSIGAESIDTATIDVTYTDGTPELKWDVINNSITDAKFRQSAATSIPGRSANSTGNVADIACSATDQFFWRNGTSIVCATAASTNLSDTANIGRLNATNSWSANNTFTTLQTSGNVGLGAAPSGTAGQLLTVSQSANTGTTVKSVNSNAGTAAFANFQAVNDTGAVINQTLFSSGYVGTFAGVPLAGAATFNTSGTSLIYATVGAAPVVLATNSLARMTLSGSTPNIGVNGAVSAVAGELLTLSDTADQVTKGVVSNTSTGTAASAMWRAASDAGTTMSITAHGSARTLNRWGIALGGWAEAIASPAATKGLAVGTTGSNPLVLGTNSQSREWISGTPKALTESVATGIAEISLANNTVCGGTLEYTIDADDGTEFQALRGTVSFVAVSKAGTITKTDGTPSETTALSAGTLTNTYSITAGAAKLTINLNAVSSLTQTTLRANYSIRISGGTCNVTPL